MHNQKVDFSLPRVDCPEKAGVSSAAFAALVGELDTTGYEYHSLMVIHRGVVAAECYRYPFNAQETHCMYSVSKNITATALGFAVSEGRVSLDTRVCEIFPDKPPHKKDDMFADTTLRHLVTMTSGKNPAAALNKSKGDWFMHLADSERKYAPGEKFQYVNECAYVLSACLGRVLGMGINDYLTPRLWNPLGIDRPYWETDSNGIEAGGWGIQLTTESLAKLALCYYRGGRLNDEQIIPEEWTRTAVQTQIYAEPKRPGDAVGYGCSVWRYSDTLWCFEGMYGQEAQVYEDRDLIIVLTGGDFCPKNKNEIFHRYADILLTDTDENALPSPEYTEFIASRAIDTYPTTALRSAWEGKLRGKTISLRRHRLLNAIGMAPGVLTPAAVFMSKCRAGNMNKLSFEFTEDSCLFSWQEGEERNTVSCRMTGGYDSSPIMLGGISFSAYSSAQWTDENTLQIVIRPMQSIAKRTLVFHFRGKHVIMESHQSPPVRGILLSVSEFLGDSISNKHIRKVVLGLFDKLDRVLEPKTRGRIK